MMGTITSINRANTRNDSLRTTIPKSIANQFDLSYKDKLEWILKAEGGELVIQLIPIKVMQGRLIELPVNHKPVLHLDDDKGVGFPIEEIITQEGITLDKESFKQKYLGKKITISLKKEKGKPTLDVKEEK
jgi:bifunctional DNA-binding transcriptional regulator/antitoxin component of YhaV-PrlF toxin-antitoxin module